jgi:hypothetical protein
MDKLGASIGITKKDLVLKDGQLSKKENEAVVLMPSDAYAGKADSTHPKSESLKNKLLSITKTAAGALGDTAGLSAAALGVIAGALGGLAVTGMFVPGLGLTAASMASGTQAGLTTLGNLAELFAVARVGALAGGAATGVGAFKIAKKAVGLIGSVPGLLFGDMTKEVKHEVKNEKAGEQKNIGKVIEGISTALGCTMGAAGGILLVSTLCAGLGMAAGPAGIGIAIALFGASGAVGGRSLAKGAKKVFKQFMNLMHEKNPQNGKFPELSKSGEQKLLGQA